MTDVLGRRPLLAVGNSNGDIPTLQCTQHADRPFLGMLVLHDDAERGAERALTQADANGWTVASIKNDWARVF